MSDQNLTTLAGQLGELKGTVASIEREMSDVRRDVGELKKSNTDILSAARTAKIFLGIIVALVALFSGWFWFLGQKAFSAAMRDEAEAVAEKVFRKEFHQLRTTAQDGQFSETTLESAAGDAAFVWKLLTPVNPASVVSATVQTSVPLPGVSITATILQDGRTCRFMLLGDTKALMDKLDVSPVSARLVIVAFSGDELVPATH